MLDMLLKTLWMRPYVFIFLTTFIIIGVLNRGLMRTLLLLVIGFVIAYISEWMSIRWGFPYGDYLYIDSAFEGELVLGGVPLWDSVSYSFLAYASYETVSYLKWRPLILISALVMTLADVVIDPITVRGDEWFLGKIYFYPEGGIFFGVPISNFVGWFIVSYAILFSYEQLSNKWFSSEPPLRAPQLGPYFYYGIMTFMGIIGVYIGEYLIVTTGILIHLPILVALRKRLIGLTSE